MGYWHVTSPTRRASTVQHGRANHLQLPKIGLFRLPEATPTARGSEPNDATAPTSGQWELVPNSRATVRPSSMAFPVPSVASRLPGTGRTSATAVLRRTNPNHRAASVTTNPAPFGATARAPGSRTGPAPIATRTSAARASPPVRAPVVGLNGPNVPIWTSGNERVEGVLTRAHRSGMGG